MKERCKYKSKQSKQCKRDARNRRKKVKTMLSPNVFVQFFSFRNCRKEYRHLPILALLLHIDLVCSEVHILGFET